MQLGAAEAEYFARHVAAVRAHNQGSAIANFAQGSAVPSHIRSLATTTLGADFVDVSKRLQDLLASTMRGSTNAKDCVFAVLRFSDSSSGVELITILKLDAIIEAAQWKMLANNRMDFKVLTDLLPEPGNLQKGLSWPDPRQDSEVMTIDRNSVSAQYFENAFDLLVSPRAKDAESELLQAIADVVPPADVAGAIAAVQSDASLSEILNELAETHPELEPVAAAKRQGSRPSGHVRAGSVRGRPLVWEADGIQVKIPSHLLDRVEKRRSGDGWELVVRTRTEPRLGPS
jgi:hypothetical protein